jgi:2-oxoglutarate ferredoxin oxidoreductase subunit gamma
MSERIGGAGKGGAGLLTCLKTLAYAAGARGWQIAFVSNYNPETRGSLVEGTLVLSPSEAVDSPIVDRFTSVLAFDLDGYQAYGNRLEPEGLVVWDAARIHDPPALEGAASYGLPSHEIAHRLGAPRSANMVLLGVLNRLRGWFSVDELVAAMESYLPVWRHGLIPPNRTVLEAVESLDLDRYRVSEEAVVGP